MTAPNKNPSTSWVEGIAKIIDAVTNLYNAVAAKSPHVADTVVILAALLPFYLAYVWSSGLKNKEKNADSRVISAKKASKKPGKGQSGGTKS